MLNCKYLIIGAGESGITLAKELNSDTHKTVLVDQAEFGGSYLHTYDFPKNLLKNETSSFATSLRIFKDSPETFGILLKHRQGLKQKIARKIHTEKNRLLNALEKGGDFQFIKGRAAFSSKGLMDVNSEDERHLISFEKCFLCVGKSSLELPKIKGLDKLPVLFKHNIFQFQETPSILAIIGCTKESLEVAAVYSGLGIKILFFEEQSSKEVLPDLDRTVFNYYIKKLMQKQVEFFFETKIKEIKKPAKSKYYTLVDTDRKEHKLTHVYVDVQEKYDVDDIDLKKIGLKVSSAGIKAKLDGQTIEKNVLVVGSANSSVNSGNKVYQIHKTIQDIKSGLINPSSRNQFLKIFKNSKALKLPSFKIIDINVEHPVVNIGLSQAKAQQEHGTYVTTDTVDNLFSDGFCKLVYKQSTGEVLGFCLAGEYATKLRSYCIEALDKGIDYASFKNFLKLYW